VDDKTEVSGENGSKARHSVVTMVGGMVVSVKTEFDPSLQEAPTVKPEISEQQLKDVLKALGKPETQEEVDKLKAMMEQAQNSTANLKDKINTLTKITVTGLPK
jgi:predicted DNA-binding ArsR family transcriptional regulator